MEEKRDKRKRKRMKQKEREREGSEGGGKSRICVGDEWGEEKVVVQMQLKCGQ